MKTIIRLFAIIGLSVVVLQVSATFGIGNFYMYYGPNQITCQKEAK